MPAEKSLLIECPACGIENLLANMAPGDPAICNQCREVMLSPILVESHTGHSCDACGMSFLLKKDSGFVVGESECQCGCSDFSPLEVGRFVSDFQPPELEDSDDIDDDFDWCRPASDDVSEGDYNNIFDDDPGFGK
ncbi:MAG: hypothetical protein H8E32_16360 [Nitrospinae bacterium]|nr:hypothetical protein [Nitrospinota bacterium]